MKNKLLTRFWLKYSDSESLAPGTKMGIGVTAYSYDDALQIINLKVFNDNAPEPIEVKEDIDISTLDLNHIFPNIGLVTERGIWYPLGYY